MVYNVPEQETEPVVTNHINGTTEEMLARFCVSEICKGWPVYRDASEWQNYRSLFTTKDTAYVFTTWSGGLSIDDFIKVSIKGRKAGDFIMHRENGTLVNLNLAKERAIGKMKATITQRFKIDNIPVDIECDCRFIFFVKKEDGEWKTQFVKLFYEKDKMLAVDGKNVPEIPAGALDEYPEGYQILAWAQAKLGHKILGGLPTANNKGFFEMYEKMAAWLQGETVDLFWEH